MDVHPTPSKRNANTPTTPFSTLSAVLYALVLTTVPVGVGMITSGKRDLLSAYETLMRWDGGWYGSIVENGYTCAEVWAPGDERNVAFLPGYPLYVRFVRWVTGLPTNHSLLVASQLACWGFWTLFFLFLRRWGVSRGAAIGGVLFLVTQPAAFYLIVSYAESFFLLNLLGFLYCADSRTRRGEMLAAVLGFLMTGTRIVGAPLAIYPLARGLLTEGWLLVPSGGPRWGRLFWLLTVGGFACLGTILFFLFCHYRFGQWDAFFKAESFGWGVKANYFAVFEESTWRIPSLRFIYRSGGLDPDWFSRCVPFLLRGLFVVLLVTEGILAWRKGETGIRERVGLYLCAFLLTYSSLSGRQSLQMAGMIRYAMPVLVLLVLAVLHLVTRVGTPRGWRELLVLFPVTFSCMVGAILQVHFLGLYTHSKWVA